MKKIIIIIVLAVSALSSCKKAGGDDVYALMSDLPIAGYLEKNPDEFSLWVDLLQYTNLFHALNTHNEYTCFVPDNEAVGAYLNENGYKSVRDIPHDYAVTIVKYHTIAGKVITHDYFLNGIISDSTASGDLLSMEIRTGGLNAIYINEQARINTLDVGVINGVIHVLDQVLTPITQTVWQKLSDGNSYSIFTKAVSLTGYETILNTISENIQTGPSEFYKKYHKYTLFAVSDATFRANGLADFNALCVYLGAGSDYESKNNALNRYVAYHIIESLMSFIQLSDFSGITPASRNISTMCGGELINLSDVDSRLLFNYGTSLDIKNDNCKNGIIHSLDGIMPIETPLAAKVVWELTDYPEIASIGGTIYRSNTQTSEKNTAVKEAAATCYTWKAEPWSEQDNAVKYNVANNTNSVKMRAINSDYLSIKMGFFGWIEMQTPTIIKGKYKLMLYHYNELGANPSGRLSFFLDGNLLGSEITVRGESKSSHQYLSKEIGTVDFDENTSHTLRILCGDVATVYLDYILFEPIQ